MKNKRLTYLALTVAGASICSSAFASTSTTTFAVTASVISACNISANTLAFGSFNPTSGSSQTGSNTVSLTCTNGTAYNVGLDAGTGSGATTKVRKMTSGTNTLNYTIYQDASRSTVWGNTIGTDTYSGKGNGTTQALTGYGAILGNQATASTGAYSDTVTVTVTY